jgi:hypothetical protein
MGGVALGIVFGMSAAAAGTAGHWTFSQAGDAVRYGTSTPAVVELGEGGVVRSAVFLNLHRIDRPMGSGFQLETEVGLRGTDGRRTRERILLLWLDGVLHRLEAPEPCEAWNGAGGRTAFPAARDFLRRLSRAEDVRVHLVGVHGEGARLPIPRAHLQQFRGFLSRFLARPPGEAWAAALH